MIGNKVDTTQAEYSVDFLDVRPTSEQLANAPAAPGELTDTYTKLPDDMPAEIEPRPARSPATAASTSRR